jgi:hypothetical protein
MEEIMEVEFDLLKTGSREIPKRPAFIPKPEFLGWAISSNFDINQSKRSYFQHDLHHLCPFHPHNTI